MIAVLFARTDSVYKSLPDCDVYDVERNALTWPGGGPVIAHPPCRLWGRLRRLSKAPDAERELATWAVSQVRQWGGVLEHPAGSTLWQAAQLPEPGERDNFGGFTVWISQWWFGHKADKPTWLYICGIEPTDLPEIPYRIGEPAFVVNTSKRAGSKGRRPEISKSEREHTPLALAEWLRVVALRVAENGDGGAGGRQKKRSPVSTPAARSIARTPSLPRAAARSRPHPGHAHSVAPIVRLIGHNLTRPERVGWK